MSSPNTSSVAFAFDIDGVLVKGKAPIPGAQETLKYLQDEGIPFIFLTNSGGVTEKENLNKLALRLGGNIKFDEEQIVQSHTPFRALVEQYQNKYVLVLGGVGDNIRNVARAYGFKNVVTSSDLYVDDVHVHPFPEMTRTHHEQYGRKKEEGKTRNIAAIMMWSSPRDWCLDLSLILDLLRPQQGREPPELFFCNPDFEWSTEAKYPRLAAGAFREALLGMWKFKYQDLELKYSICGKPTEMTYVYGEKALQKVAGARGEGIKKVWMIGDSTSSDINAPRLTIKGANAYSSRCSWEWGSVLVETGIHKAGTIPEVQPTYIARDVQEAVEWALKNVAAQDA